jgi:hypothetical protein
VKRNFARRANLPQPDGQSLGAPVRRVEECATYCRKAAGCVAISYDTWNYDDSGINRLAFAASYRKLCERGLKSLEPEGR